MHLLPAKKIISALHKRSLQMGREVPLQERHVLLEQLLLQRLRRRGHHHAPPAADAGAWNQVSRQRFARAGSRFDDGVLVLLESFFGDSRHLQLRRPELVPRMPLLQHPARPENPLDRYLFLFCRRRCRCRFLRHDPLNPVRLEAPA